MPRNQLPASLSRPQARMALLAAQGLEGTTLHPRSDVLLTSIETMGQLQIDTIHVVARSPYFVLWSRIGSYDPSRLEKALEDRHIYEAWSHEASFLPRHDLANTRARIDHPHSWRKSLLSFLEAHRQEANELLAYVEANGPVRSADFTDPTREAGGWWNWKYEKRLLESLFAAGELMVARRDRFQRVYDLTERVFPEWVDIVPPSSDDMIRSFLRQTTRSLGVAHERWLADYYRLKSVDVRRVLPGLLTNGDLQVTSIEGLPGAAYVATENLEPLDSIRSGELKPERTALLSPFDPVVWDRRRGEELFDFVYRIECYTPAEKRQYGYFSLPILHRGKLVGRLDAKAHRQQSIFEIRSLYLESGISGDDEELATDLARVILDCAEWHETPRVRVRRSRPRNFAPLLRQQLTLLRNEHKTGAS